MPKINQRVEELEEIFKDLCLNDVQQITISKLNNTMKEKVSGKPGFVFAICYKGSLASSISVILLCCY